MSRPRVTRLVTGATDRGENRLGGCILGAGAPDLECLGCGAALRWVAAEDDAD